MPALFTYGAQMIHPVALERGRRGALHGWDVRFTALGLPVLEPAFANVEPASGGVAWGVLVPFDDATYARVVEGEYPYRVQAVEVDVDGQIVAASVLVAVEACRLSASRRPSRRYLEKLVAGATHHGLPEPVVERYRREREAASAVTARIPGATRVLYPVARVWYRWHLGRRR